MAQILFDDKYHFSNGHSKSNFRLQQSSTQENLSFNCLEMSALRNLIELKVMKCRKICRVDFIPSHKLEDSEIETKSKAKYCLQCEVEM